MFLEKVIKVSNCAYSYLNCVTRDSRGSRTLGSQKIGWQEPRSWPFLGEDSIKNQMQSQLGNFWFWFRPCAYVSNCTNVFE